MSFLALLALLMPVVLVIVVIVFLVGFVRRMPHRADERLELDKQRTSMLQQQLQDINSRLTAIENLLRQVE